MVYLLNESVTLSHWRKKQEQFIWMKTVHLICWDGKKWEKDELLFVIFIMIIVILLLSIFFLEGH